MGSKKKKKLNFSIGHCSVCHVLWLRGKTLGKVQHFLLDVACRNCGSWAHLSSLFHLSEVQFTCIAIATDAAGQMCEILTPAEPCLCVLLEFNSLSLLKADPVSITVACMHTTFHLLCCQIENVISLQVACIIALFPETECFLAFIDSVQCNFLCATS